MIRRTEKEVSRNVVCPHCKGMINYHGKTEIVFFASATTVSTLSNHSPLRQILQLQCPYCQGMFKTSVWVEKGIAIRIRRVEPASRT